MHYKSGSAGDDLQARGYKGAKAREAWTLARAKRKNRCLLPDHLDEDPVGQFPSEQVNHPALNVAFQDLALGPWLGIRLAPLRSTRIASPAGLIPRSLVSLFPALPHPPVHGVIGQAVGLGVAGAQRS